MKILLLLALITISCTSHPKELLSNFETDFPKVDTLNGEKMNTFELYSDPMNFVVKDSLLFAYERTKEHFGRCFSINSGNELAKVVTKGNASFEVRSADFFRLFADSIEVLSANTPRTIKLFSIDDMLNGETPRPRAIALPDSVFSFYYELIDYNTIMGISTLRGEENNHKYFILTPNELFNIGEMNEELFTSTADLTKQDLRMSSSGLLSRNEDKIVYVSSNGLHIDVIDLKKRTIEASRYYYKIAIELKDHGNGATSLSSTSEFKVMAVECNNDNIVITGRYIAPEVSNAKTHDCVLVFDWNLKPIRKYYLNPYLYLGAYISEDGRFVYSLSPVDDHFVLYRYKL